MKFHSLLSHALITGCISMLLVSTVSAHDKDNRSRRGPPQEAIDACIDQARKATCQFTSPRGRDLNGMCVTPRNGDAELVCKPNRKKNKSRRNDDDLTG